MKRIRFIDEITGHRISAIEVIIFGSAPELVLAAVAIQVVLPDPAVQFVVTTGAEQVIVAFAAKNVINGVASPQGVITAVAEQLIDPPEIVWDARRRRVERVGLGAADEGVATVAADDLGRFVSIVGGIVAAAQALDFDVVYA